MKVRKTSLKKPSLGGVSYEMACMRENPQRRNVTLTNSNSRFNSLLAMVTVNGSNVDVRVQCSYCGFWPDFSVLYNLGSHSGDPLSPQYSGIIAQVPRRQLV
jgi:hypothetical protein